MSFFESVVLENATTPELPYEPLQYLRKIITCDGKQYTLIFSRPAFRMYIAVMVDWQATCPSGKQVTFSIPLGYSYDKAMTSTGEFIEMGVEIRLLQTSPIALITPAEYPPKEPQLIDMQDKIIEKEAEIADLKRRVSELEGEIPLTPEEQDKIAELDRQIASIQFAVGEKETEIASLRGKAASLETELAKWRRRETSVRSAWDSVRRVEFDIEEAGETEWEFRNVIDLPLFERAIEDWKELITSIDSRSTYVGKTYSVNFGYGLIVTSFNRVLGAPPIYTVLNDERYNSSVHLKSMFDAATEKVASLENELRNAKNILYATERELSSLKYSLNDAIATKGRVELEIRRAVALREAEFYAAKSRLDLGIMLLAQLKASEEMLRAQIEMAKMEAIARSAREREALLKAEETEKLKLAEELRIKAEEAEAMARITTGTEAQRYEELRGQIETELAKALADAQAIARRREEQAGLTADAQAQEALARMEALEAGKKLEEAKVLSIAIEAAPAIGLIALVALGALVLVGGKKKPTTPRGKYLAKKK